MSFRVTGILAAILITAGAFWYFYDYKGEKIRAEQARLERLLFRFDRDDVIGVTVSKGDTTVICEWGQDSSWVIRFPVKTAGDRRAITDVVRHMNSIERVESVVEWADREQLAEFGLLNPSLSVYLDGVRADTLLVGNSMMWNGQSYARLSGKPEVLTVSTSPLGGIPKTLYDLRDKRAIPFARERVRRIEISASNGQIVLERENDTWQMKRPLEDRGDPTTVNRLLWSLTGPRVRKFIDEVPREIKKYGLNPAKASVTVFEGEEMSRKTLDIGETTGGLNYAKFDQGPPVFAVDSSLANRITAGTDAYRYKMFAEFERKKVKKIELVGRDTTVAFERGRDGLWGMAGPVDEGSVVQRADAILRGIIGLEAKRFVSESPDRPAEFGFDRPGLSARLTGDEGPVLTLTLGRKIGDRIYAQTDRRETVYEARWDNLEERLKTEGINIED